MPRVRRRSKHRPDVPDEAYVELLSNGHHWPFVFNRDTLTDEELADLWAEFGERVTAEHIAEHPCTRPWGWWKFEMPEPRRVVDGWQDPEDGFAPWHFLPPGQRNDEAFQKAWPPKIAELLRLKAAGDDRRKFYYGRPNPVTGRSTATYETQCDYLDRLFFLTDEERGMLAIHPELREAGY